MKTVLAPVDFSPATPGVLREAALLASPADTRLVVVNVLAPLTVTADIAVVPANAAELNRIVGEASTKRLEALRLRMEGNFIRTETQQRWGAAVPEILECAREVAADYIVMGTHGHTAWYEVLVGSTARGVLKRATCPVVIVPREAGAS